MGWLALLEGILAGGPLLERLLAGFGGYVASLAQEIWRADAAAQVRNGIDAAGRIITEVTTDAPAALQEVQTLYPTYHDLEARFPGLMQSIVAKHVMLRDVGGMTHGLASKFIEVAHANVKTRAS